MRKILTEIDGMPSSGKTHAAIEGWPDVLLVDTAFTSMGFRQADIESDPDGRGESWANLLKSTGYDHEEAEKRYLYLDSWKEAHEFPDGYTTVVLDNAADLKVLAVNHWVEQRRNPNSDSDPWPQQAQWGQINDMVDRLILGLTQRFHVVVISQMKEEYDENGNATGNYVRDGPKRMDFKADFRIRMSVDDDGRHAYVRKNRFLDPTGDERGTAGTDLGYVDFEELLLLSEIPESEWGF